MAKQKGKLVGGLVGTYLSLTECNRARRNPVVLDGARLSSRSSLELDKIQQSYKRAP